MNPVFKPRCIVILCIGCTDADMLTLWRMMPAAVLLRCARSKLTTAGNSSEEAKLRLLF